VHVQPHDSQADAIKTLTFWHVKQITIEELLGVEKTCCIMRFPCDCKALVGNRNVFALIL